jgi:hypothetical protein
MILVALAACTQTPRPPLGPSGPPDTDAGVYESCTTLCLRPGDCEQAYPSDGEICPPGFRCAFRFQCTTDGGSGG